MGWSREHGALLESFASWMCLRLVGLVVLQSMGR